MAFWDNISQKATVTTAKAVQKAKEMSDIARLNSMVSEEETKINNLYYQVGKLYVTMHPQDYEAEFAGMIASLAESEEKVKNYRQQIQDIKGVARCTQCGAEVQAGVAFCSACGAPMPKLQSGNAEELTRCDGCGAMVKKGVRFCTSCGKPMVQIAAPETTAAPTIEPPETVVQNAVAEAAPVPAAQPEVQARICPNCGKQVDADVAFCTECGTKL